MAHVSLPPDPSQSRDSVELESKSNPLLFLSSSFFFTRYLSLAHPLLRLNIAFEEQTKKINSSTRTSWNLFFFLSIAFWLRRFVRSIAVIKQLLPLSIYVCCC